MTMEEAVAFTESCMNGEPAPCAYICPFNLDVRSFIEKSGRGRWNAAYKMLRNAVIFPAVVCKLCAAPCENKCNRRRTGDEPIAIRRIEETCVRLAKGTKPDSYALPPKNERIAVVGAGLAGLSAALCLALKKYRVTVFDGSDGWGGALRTHLCFGGFDEELSSRFSVTDAEFRYGKKITSLGELQEFDLIYIATGSGGDDFGMKSRWEPKLLTTSDTKVFMGGAVTGASLEESITQGIAISKTAEVYFQTGKASETFDGGASVRVCMVDCSSAPRSPRVHPSSPDGYNEDEAKAEAARCLQCDCDACMASCEMLGAFRKKPKKIAMEVYTDTKAMPPYSTHTLTRQAYSCNICGHCKTVCPEDIDIGSLLQKSRAERTQDAEYPRPLHDFWLREMEFSAGEASFFSAPGENPGYVFFPGCRLGAHKPGYVLEPYRFLRERYRSGIFLGCCGAPASWAGETKMQNDNFGRIRETWRKLGSPKFILACATCESIFSIFLPEIQRVSLYELLAENCGELPAHRQVFEKAAVFDPCNARENRAMEQAVRDIARSSGISLSELPEKNRCCGYGGHMRLANPKLYETITGNRSAMSDDPYITYCVNCSEVFRSRGKSCAHVLDAAFDLPLTGGVPGIDEKRENAIEVKKSIMKELTGMDYAAEAHEWDKLELTIEEAVAESIDRKLISFSDMKEAIWFAEKTGSKFVDGASGVCHCSMEKPVLTYWVQYKETGDCAYEVYGAYYHRMRVKE